MYIHISSLMTHKSKLQILEFLRKLHVVHSVKEAGKKKKSNLYFPGGKIEPQQESTMLP